MSQLLRKQLVRQHMMSAKCTEDESSPPTSRSTSDAESDGSQDEVEHTHHLLLPESSRLTRDQFRAIFEEECPPVVDMQEKLGAGAFGEVFVASTPALGKVAIKRAIENAGVAQRELEVIAHLAEANHPNIVRVHGFWCACGPWATARLYAYPPAARVRYASSADGERALHLVMECFPQTLRGVLNVLMSRGQRMRTARCADLMFQLTRGLTQLEAKGVIHRDLKPENILVSDDAKTLKICDFGSAKLVTPNMTSVTYISSRYYRAPEALLDRDQYGTAIDVRWIPPSAPPWLVCRGPASASGPLAPSTLLKAPWATRHVTKTGLGVRVHFGRVREIRAPLSRARLCAATPRNHSHPWEPNCGRCSRHGLFCGVRILFT